MQTPRITELPQDTLQSLLLLAAQADHLDAIVDAASAAGPTSGLVPLARAVALEVDLSPRLVLAMLEALDNLVRLVVDIGFTVEQVLDLFTQGIRENSDAAVLASWEQGKPAIQRAMDRLGQGSSLTISSKAASLVLDEQNQLLDARILTDIRPIFTQHAALDVIHGIVVQHLMIDFVASGGPKQTLSIALGKKDLDKLLAACQRAQEKLVAASKWWSSTGLPAPLTRE